MKDMSYNAVMGRRAEIIKSAVGMDYSRLNPVLSPSITRA